jgi:acetyl esterase/lipase
VVQVIHWVLTVALLLSSSVALRPVRTTRTDGLAWVIGWPASELAGPVLVLEGAVAALTWWRHWPTGRPGVVLTVLTLVVLLENLTLFLALVLSRVFVARGLRQGPTPLSIRTVRPRYTTAARNLLGAALRPRDVTVSRDVHYGPLPEHRLDVYRQPTTPRGAPVFLYFHGGGWAWGSKREQGRPVLFELVRQGYVVVSANYRLSPQHRWPAHIEDATRALAWVKRTIESYGGDPDRVVLSGNSAGGQLCALLALTSTTTPFLPADLSPTLDLSVRGCVPYYGVLEMMGDDRHWRRHGRGLQHMLEHLVFPPTDTPDSARVHVASPIDRITPTAPPFLLIHGTNDTLVDVQVGRSFAQKYHALVPDGALWQIEVPFAQHAFDQSMSPRTAAVARAVVAFANHVTQGDPPPVRALDPATRRAYAVPPTELRIEGFASPQAAAATHGPLVVLTACNPGALVAEEVAPHTNALLDEALGLELAWFAWPRWRTSASAPDGTWVEPGYAVATLSLEEAHRWARRYGQLAFYLVTPTDVTVVPTA